MKIKLLIILGLFFSTGVLNSQTIDSTKSEKDLFITAHSLAANEFNDSLLIEYIKLYPEGIYTEKAKSAIDICSWQNACYKNTIESYQEYMNNFPKGKAITLAQKKIDALKQTPKADKK